MNEDRNNSIIASFSSFMKANGMRQTFERKVILDIVLGITHRFGYQKVIDELYKREYKICRSTVFNTLTLLVHADVLRRKMFDDGQYYYEFTNLLSSGNQIYTICTECGRIADVKNKSISDTLSKIKPGTFAPSCYSLNIYGLCACCQRRLRKSKTITTAKINSKHYTNHD